MAWIYKQHTINIENTKIFFTEDIQCRPIYWQCVFTFTNNLVNNLFSYGFLKRWALVDVKKVLSLGLGPTHKYLLNHIIHVVLN